MNNNPSEALYNPDAEQAYLGGMLVAPDKVLLSDIACDDFYDHRHQFIWRAMLNLSNRNIMPDYLTVIEELKSMNFLEQVGGPAYLTQLIASSDGLFLDNHAELIRDKALRRKVLSVAQELAKAAYVSNGDIKEHALSIVSGLTVTMDNKSNSRTFTDLASEYYDILEERKANPTNIWGLQTGFYDIDHYLGGIQKGETFLIVGEPSVGKSKFLVQLCIQMALPRYGNHSGLICSLEMKYLPVFQRAVSMMAEVPTRNMKTGEIPDDQWIKLVGTIGEISELPIILDDTPAITVEQFRAKVAAAKLRYKIEWVGLDYLLLMGGAKGKDDTEKSTYLSNHVKSIGHEFDVAIVSVNSVTKEYMDRAAPSKRGVRGSGQVIHNADVIAFLTEHVPDEDNMPRDPNLQTLTFVKVREGDVGLSRVQFRREKSFPRYYNLTTQSLTETNLSAAVGVDNRYWDDP